MDFHFLTIFPFYISILLFLFFALFALFSPKKLALISKIIILFIVVILFAFNQAFQYEKLSQQVKKELINSKLETVNQFNHFVPGQKLRSNIFFFNEKKRKYYIKYQYNMDEDRDKNIEIPENLGCTGEAWRTKVQVFGTKDMIFAGGPFRIPEEELVKVSKDLEWVCSTPILDDNGNVIAVMNFDGNRKLIPEQIDQIKSHCRKISAELKDILK